MKNISIDIETFSDVDLQKCGVYKYAQSPNFEILLFAYSVDSGEVSVIDLAQGETLPEEILDALTDEQITKWAFNANFERVCLSEYLSHLCRLLVGLFDVHGVDAAAGEERGHPLPDGQRPAQHGRAG